MKKEENKTVTISDLRFWATLLAFFLPLIVWAIKLESRVSAINYNSVQLEERVNSHVVGCANSSKEIEEAINEIAKLQARIEERLKIIERNVL